MAASSAVRRAEPGRLYPWIFVAAMGLVILVNAGMIYLAVHSFTGLATQDPYGKGLAFNRTLAAAQAQAAPVTTGRSTSRRRATVATGRPRRCRCAANGC